MLEKEKKRKENNGVKMLDKEKRRKEKNGVQVNMSIRAENGDNIIFGEDYDLSVIDMNDQSSYTVNYVGDFEALNKSNQGDFSFIVNFELTYN